MLKKSFFSLGLRFGTVFLKFLFLLYFAKELPTSELGVYGLFVITVSLMTYVIGLDFYQYNTRELLKSSDPLPLLVNQGVLHFLTYILVLPVSLVIFQFDILPWDLLQLFFILTISEHISQETHRILITVSEPVKANIILFIRNGSWVLVFMILSLSSYQLISLNWVLKYWLVSSVLSSLIGVLYLYNYFKASTFTGVRIHWNWIFEGMKVSFYFFGTSLLLKGVEFSDRYFIKYFYTDQEVGVYTFYFSIANVLNTFVITGVASLIAPIIIRSYQTGDIETYQLNIKRLSIATLISIVVISSLILIFSDFLLIMINKKELLESKTLLYLILGYVSVFLIGLIPQYELYVRKKDKVAFMLNVPAFLVCIALNFVLVPEFGGTGAATSTLLSYFLLTLLKFHFAYKVKQNGE